MGMVINPFGVVAGGGPPAGGDLRTVVGNPQYIVVTSSSNSNGVLVKITAPSGANSLLSAVQFATGSVGAGVGFKALLVADSAGSPSSTVLAIGTATVPGIISAETVVTLPFASGQTLTAGTAYWIGFVPSASAGISIDNGSFAGNTDGMQVAVTYASPTWDSSTDVAGSKYLIWGNCEQAGAATGTHQQGSTTIFAGSSTMRIAIPAYAIGDTVRINFGQDFGTLPTLTGFTKTYDDQISSFSGLRHCIYTRVIDGSENGTIAIDAPSGNNRIAVATVFRAGGTLEGKTANTNTGTAVTSAAVTTSGSNRRVFNFVMSGFNGGTASNTESADTWADAYNLVSQSANKYVASLSYKDVAAAGSSGTESRTVNNGFWHVTSFAIPDV